MCLKCLNRGEFYDLRFKVLSNFGSPLEHTVATIETEDLKKEACDFVMEWK